MDKRELVIAPVGEAVLILVAGVAGWAAHQPLVFASLGPTAYELIETPHRRSAEPYSILMGHGVGVGAAYVALWLTGAWRVAAVSAAGVPLERVWCATVAAALTVLGTLVANARQPAAIASCLLIALGMLQRPQDAGVILAGVALMTVVGEPLRRVRLRGQAFRKVDERMR
jgi:hypothetical protein